VIQRKLLRINALKTGRISNSRRALRQNLGGSLFKKEI